MTYKLAPYPSDTRFPVKTSEKIAWHKPSDMPTFSATSPLVSQRSVSITISFTVSTLSSALDVLGCPRRASSLTSSRRSLESLYHLKTFFVAQRACILYVIVHSVQIMRSIFVIAKNYQQSNLYIRQKQTKNGKWPIMSTYVMWTCVPALCVL